MKKLFVIIFICFSFLYSAQADADISIYGPRPFKFGDSVLDVIQKAPKAGMFNYRALGEIYGVNVITYDFEADDATLSSSSIKVSTMFRFVNDKLFEISYVFYPEPYDHEHVWQEIWKRISAYAHNRWFSQSKRSEWGYSWVISNSRISMDIDNTGGIAVIHHSLPLEQAVAEAGERYANDEERRQREERRERQRQMLDSIGKN